MPAMDGPSSGLGFPFPERVKGGVTAMPLVPPSALSELKVSESRQGQDLALLSHHEILGPSGPWHPTGAQQWLVAWTD